jgi:hypothetical protein
VKLQTRMRGRFLVRALIIACVATTATAGIGIASASTGPSAGATPTGGQQPGTTTTAHFSVRVAVRQHVLSGRSDLVKGSIAPAQKGRTVIVQARGARGGWHVVTRAHTGGKGRFAASWRPRSVGHYDVRAKLAGAAAQDKAKGGVTVYRTSYVSWYGPGFYGHRTACGGTLQSGTLGVANKTLPCGTRVTLRYRGNTVTVPVIDRGPYVAGREYDLTGATKSRLHFGSTGTLWSAPHRH